MLKKFYEEHLHEDEEIRFVVGGRGQFDIRDKNDRWVACTVEEGDLIIVPTNTYHRFGLGGSDFIHAMRLFTDAPKWIAIPREEQASDESQGTKRKEAASPASEPEKKKSKT
eukprot:TRINITY_DN16911_c0_g1_i1.p2 TRINITY_DN16911_c0_g1~~TRINITY_DN16911_c0_g1_i1.p2  ORF type:complete len:112 (+),score=37.23 TRINITY_DN16911_c0_g1_i1:296-631(+)